MEPHSTLLQNSTIFRHSGMYLHYVRTRHQLAYKQTSSLESLIEAIEVDIAALEATDLKDSH